MTIKTFPGPPPISGNVVKMQLHEISRYHAAAQHARRIHPGPLGELVFRELTAYADFGYRFDTEGLIPRLAATILATRPEHRHPEVRHLRP